MQPAQEFENDLQFAQGRMAEVDLHPVGQSCVQPDLDSLRYAGGGQLQCLSAPPEFGRSTRNVK